MKLLLLALLLALGCSSTPKEPDPLWRTNEVVVSSDRVLWKVVLLALERQGFPLAGGLDPSSMVVTTGWRTDLSPFSSEGFRSRAEVHMEPLGPKRWALRARVKKQVNKALAKPLDPRYAKWEWVADDERAAEVLIQHVRARLDTGIELSDEPRDPVQAYIEKREREGRP